MIGFYNYTVYMTFLSLLASSLGICFAGLGQPRYAIYCLIVSGVCDMFDGKIARTRKRSTEQEKKFGIQLDSLSDIVCFGVLPAVIGISMILPDSTVNRAVTWGVSCLFILCALIRLAYFNVTEEERQKTTTARRTSYLGLPVTTSALIFPLAYALSLLLPGGFGQYIYPFAMLVTAVCFVSPFPVRKPKGLYLILLCVIGLLEVALIIWLVLGGEK